jgi:hypothetical protein
MVYINAHKIQLVGSCNLWSQLCANSMLYSIYTCEKVNTLISNYNVMKASYKLVLYTIHKAVFMNKYYNIIIVSLTSIQYWVVFFLMHNNTVLVA